MAKITAKANRVVDINIHSDDKTALQNPQW